MIKFTVQIWLQAINASGATSFQIKLHLNSIIVETPWMVKKSQIKMKFMYIIAYMCDAWF